MAPETIQTCIPADAGITFCYSTKASPSVKQDNRFFLAIAPTVYADPAGDLELIQKIIGPIRQGPLPVFDPPPYLRDFKGSRLYDITPSLPSIIPEKLWTYEAYPGPNCYQSAFCSKGFDYTCGRYVDSIEVEFLLSLFFLPASEADCERRFGSIAIFKEKMFGFAPGPSSSPKGLKARLQWLVDQKEMRRRHQFIPTEEHVRETSLFSYGTLPYYEAGAHATFSLGAKDTAGGGGLIFHKLSFYYNDGYRIDPIGLAMKQVEAAAQRHIPPFERWPGNQREIKYEYKCYRLRPSATPPAGKVQWEKRERDYYLRLFDYYSGRIQTIAKAIAQKGREDETFDESRIGLLTMENFWRLMKKFNDRISYDQKSFLSNDWGLAKAFFTAYGLSWEYRAMSDTYYEMKPGRERGYYQRRLRELYAKHYLKIDMNFVGEIHLYLDVNGVPKGYWPKITKAVIEELTREEGGKKKYDPIIFADSNGEKGAPFFDILEGAISASTGSRLTP